MNGCDPQGLAAKFVGQRQLRTDQITIAPFGVLPNEAERREHMCRAIDGVVRQVCWVDRPNASKEFAEVFAAGLLDEKDVGLLASDQLFDGLQILVLTPNIDGHDLELWRCLRRRDIDRAKPINSDNRGWE